MPPIKISRSKLSQAILASSVLVTGNPATYAATITVDTGGDSTTTDVAGCSLREAVVSLSTQSLETGCTIDTGVFGDDDTIVIDLPNGTSAIDLDAAEIAIVSTDMTIRGNGAYISSNFDSRAFGVDDSTVTIDSVTLQGNSGSNGGAIYTEDSNVTIINSKLYGNRAIRGGGVYSTSSTLTISNSELYSNSTSRGGSAIRVGQSVLDIDNSIIRDNSADYSSGVLLLSGVDASISNSTISENISTGNRAGIAVGQFASLTLQNSTISSNTAGSRASGLSITGGLVRVENSTLFENSVTGSRTEGLNLTAIRGESGVIVNSEVTVLNSIFGGAGGYDCFVGNYSTVTFDSQSIVQDGSCGSQRAVDPLLGVLADNGGSTETHRPDPASPALDTGNVSVCGTRDQRGEPRNQDAGFFVPVVASNGNIATVDLDAGECDVGSVEVP